MALPDRQRGAKGLAVAVLFCLASALLPASASAHEPTTEEYTYEVEVPKTRQVPVYSWVSLRIRVAPFYKTVPVYGTRLVVKCANLVYGNPNSRICWPESVRVQTGIKQVPVYNYKTGEPFQVQTGTRTETYTVTETRTGTRQVHDPHYEPPTPTPTPKPKPTPTATPREGGTAAARPCPTGTYPSSTTRIWIVQTAQGPRHVTADQATQDPSITLNGELADMEPVSGSHCWRPVLPPATPLSFSIPFREIYDAAIAKGKTAAEAVVAAYRATDAALYQALCTNDIATGTGVAAAFTAEGLNALKIAQKTAKASGYTSLAAGAVWAACKWEERQPDSIQTPRADPDRDNGDDNAPTREGGGTPPPPPPTATATPTATPEPRSFNPERDCYRYYRGTCYNIENGQVVIYYPPDED